MLYLLHVTLCILPIKAYRLSLYNGLLAFLTVSIFIFIDVFSPFHLLLIIMIPCLTWCDQGLFYEILGSKHESGILCFNAQNLALFL